MFNQQVNPYALLGAEMAQQASAQNQVRKAMEPKSDQVVARAKTIMGMISPASPMSGFPGQAPMPPQNPFAQGMGMPQSPMGMPPQVPGFANGGQVDSNSLMSAVFGKSPDALFKALMGRDLAGSTTQDIADYQQKLQGYGAGDALNKE
ncbi:MAG: hypothetical protein EBR82_31135, partial [Caulobacteraceae bacterium]|nr:hypothetical protein [Caulobacteraceae bacterium]